MCSCSHAALAGGDERGFARTALAPRYSRTAMGSPRARGSTNNARRNTSRCMWKPISISNLAHAGGNPCRQRHEPPSPMRPHDAVPPFRNPGSLRQQCQCNLIVPAPPGASPPDRYVVTGIGAYSTAPALGLPTARAVGSIAAPS